MKISEVELGTVIDVPSQSITGAVLVAKSSHTHNAGLNYLLGRAGKKPDLFWKMSDKLWFDRIVHSFVPPAQLPLRYDWGYWIGADTEVKIASSITTKKPAELLSINDLPLGSIVDTSIVDTDYAGKIIKATIIARAGASGCPDALLGWEEEPTCDTATKSLTRKTTIQAPRPYSNYTYLQDHQHIIDKYPKSIWVTGTSKVSKVYDPPKPKQAPAKDLSLGDVIDAEYYGLIKHGTIIGKQKSSGNVLIGWPKDESKNSTTKHISDTHYQCLEGSNQTYLIDDSKELERQYPNSIWITGKEQATLIRETEALLKETTKPKVEPFKQIVNFKLGDVVEVQGVIKGEATILKRADDNFLLGFTDPSMLIGWISKATKDNLYTYRGRTLETQWSDDKFMAQHYPHSIWVSSFAVARLDPNYSPDKTTIDVHLEQILTSQQIDKLKEDIEKTIKEATSLQKTKTVFHHLKRNEDGDIVFEAQETKEGIGSSIKPSFTSMLKSDATNAAYRVASTQITHATKSLIVGMMQKAGSSSTSITALTQMLDSQMGEALIAYLMGMGLQQTSLVDDARIQKIAEECRILGMTSVGNQAFEMLMEVVMPVISQALQTLPTQEAPIKIEASKSTETELEADEIIEEEITQAPKQLTV